MPTPLVTSSCQRRAISSLIAGGLVATILSVATPTAAETARADRDTATARDRSDCTRARAPRYRRSKTRFGISVSTSSMNLPEAMEYQQDTFGRLPAVRIFDPAIPPDNAWERRRESLRRRLVVNSFRMPPQDVLAGVYDRELRRYFRTAPRKQPIMWSYIHEPEPMIDAGMFTARQYRRAFRRITNIAHRFCRGNLFPTMILTGWTADPDSDRDWRDYYAGRRYVSVVAWDPYNSATSRPIEYVAPRRLYRDVVRASRASRKPWGIAETGSMLVSGDDGQGRARWLRRMGRYFNRKGARFVTYFQSTHDGDFELRDQPSISAWRTWISK